MGQRDQPRVRDGAREGGFGSVRSNLLGADLVVRLRDLKSVAQGNPCEHDRAHGSTSREVCQACSLQRGNKAVVDVETLAHRPQVVTGAGSSPTKETVMQSLKTVTGWYQRPQQRIRNHRLDCANRSMGRQLASDADTRLSDSTAGAGKGAKGDLKGACSATITCKRHAKGTCARGGQVQILTQMFRFEARRQGRQRQESKQREKSVQQVWKDHDATLGKIVSRAFFLCASCVDITPGFVIV